MDAFFNKVSKGDETTSRQRHQRDTRRNAGTFGVAPEAEYRFGCSPPLSLLMVPDEQAIAELQNLVAINMDLIKKMGNGKQRAFGSEKKEPLSAMHIREEEQNPEQGDDSEKPSRTRCRSLVAPKGAEFGFLADVYGWAKRNEYTVPDGIKRISLSPSASDLEIGIDATDDTMDGASSRSSLAESTTPSLEEEDQVSLEADTRIPHADASPKFNGLRMDEVGRVGFGASKRNDSFEFKSDKSTLAYSPTTSERKFGSPLRDSLSLGRGRSNSVDSAESKASLATIFSYSDVKGSQSVERASTDVGKESRGSLSILAPLKPSPQEEINSATCERLIDYLTSSFDHFYILEFFLTYRLFITPVNLLKSIFLRIRWATAEPDMESKKQVRLRSMAVLRYWVSTFFNEDFAQSKKLRYLLATNVKSFLGPYMLNCSNASETRVFKSLEILIKHQFVALKEELQVARLSGRRSRASSSSLMRNTGDSNRPSSHDSSGSSSIRLGGELVRMIDNSDVGRNSENPSLDGFDCRNQQRLGGEHKRDSFMKDGLPVLTKRRSFISRLPFGSLSFGQILPTLKPFTQKRNVSDNTEPIPATFIPDNPEAREDEQPLCQRKSSRRLSRRLSLSTTIVFSYRPFVLDFDPKLVATQFAIIEQAVLEKVIWMELLKPEDWNLKKEKDSNQQEEKSTVLDLIDRFNQTCQWVASEIVCTPKLETRSKVIETFIQIAEEAYLQKNFSTFMEIMLGLQNPSIERLERTWERINTHTMKTFQILKTLSSPFSKFKPIREEMSRIADEFGGIWSTQQASESLEKSLHFGGCIPFTGLYLGDIAQMLDLPVFQKPASSELSSVGMGDQTVVNFGRMRVLANTIRRFRAFQDPALSYNFQPDPICFSLVTFLKTLENISLREKSLECEPM
ncbi:hypothetical protein HDU97_006478 [Phlyctochytrium planicorne]|nr:hypothetical protein HDU97_006478 [Phlyctochytrium planicorne]